MTTLWGEHQHVFSTSKGASPSLQDSWGHWVSVASHFPAVDVEAGEGALLHGEHPLPGQVTAHPLASGNSRLCPGEGGSSPIPLVLPAVGWIFPRPGAAGRDAATAGAAAMVLSSGIPCADSAPCQELSAIGRGGWFFTSRRRTWDILFAPSLPPAALGATQPWLCSEAVPAPSVSLLPPPIPFLIYCPSLKEALGPMR